VGSSGNSGIRFAGRAKMHRASSVGDAYGSSVVVAASICAAKFVVPEIRGRSVSSGRLVRRSSGPPMRNIAHCPAAYDRRMAQYVGKVAWFNNAKGYGRFQQVRIPLHASGADECAQHGRDLGGESPPAS
jgi:hypothetical protein